MFYAVQRWSAPYATTLTSGPGGACSAGPAVAAAARQTGRLAADPKAWSPPTRQRRGPATRLGG